MLARSPEETGQGKQGQTGTNQIVYAAEAGPPPCHPAEGWRVGSSQGMATRSGQEGHSPAAGVPPRFLFGAQ